MRLCVASDFAEFLTFVSKAKRWFLVFYGTLDHQTPMCALVEKLPRHEFHTRQMQLEHSNVLLMSWKLSLTTSQLNNWQPQERKFPRLVVVYAIRGRAV